MRSWAMWTAKAVVCTTGFAAAGGGLAGVALAGTGTPSTGNTSAVSGNQIFIPVTAPFNVCGNAAAVLGFATASCQGGASVIRGGQPAGRGSAVSKGNISAGSGNAVLIPIQAAVNTCGNAVGNATAHCQGGVSLPGGGQIAAAGSGGGTGNVRIGSGNRVYIPVSVPVNICGNAAAVLGDSTAGCAGGAFVGVHPQQAATHGRNAKPVTGREAKSTAAHPPKPAQLVGLGTRPAEQNVLGLVRPLLHDIPLLGSKARTGSRHVVRTMPATVSALRASVAGQPMSDNSLTSLALGALLVGAAALKIAGRRGGRAREEVSA